MTNKWLLSRHPSGLLHLRAQTSFLHLEVSRIVATSLDLDLYGGCPSVGILKMVGLYWKILMKIADLGVPHGTPILGRLYIFLMLPATHHVNSPSALRNDLQIDPCLVRWPKASGQHCDIEVDVAQGSLVTCGSFSREDYPAISGPWLPEKSKKSENLRKPAGSGNLPGYQCFQRICMAPNPPFKETPSGGEPCPPATARSDPFAAVGSATTQRHPKPSRIRPVQQAPKKKTENCWFILEKPAKMDDLGVRPFMETSNYTSTFQRIRKRLKHVQKFSASGLKSFWVSRAKDKSVNIPPRSKQSVGTPKDFSVGTSILHPGSPMWLDFMLNWFTTKMNLTIQIHQNLSSPHTSKY